MHIEFVRINFIRSLDSGNYFCVIVLTLKHIEVDDIIAFKSGDRVIVHRVVDIDKGVYITKGDNNNDSDDLYLTLDDIDGVVEFRIPYIAYPSVMISKYLN